MFVVMEPYTYQFWLSILDYDHCMKRSRIKCRIYSTHIAFKMYSSSKSFHCTMYFHHGSSFFVCFLFTVASHTNLWEMLFKHHMKNISYPYSLQDVQYFEILPIYHVLPSWKLFFSHIFCLWLLLTPTFFWYKCF